MTISKNRRPLEENFSDNVLFCDFKNTQIPQKLCVSAGEMYPTIYVEWVKNRICVN